MKCQLRNYVLSDMKSLKKEERINLGLAYHHALNHTDMAGLLAVYFRGVPGMELKSRLFDIDLRIEDYSDEIHKSELVISIKRYLSAMKKRISFLYLDLKRQPSFPFYLPARVTIVYA